MRITLTVVLLQAGALSFASTPPPAVAQRTITMGEMGLREQARTAPLPDYPVDALAKQRSGVAVASIAVGEDGHTASADILEAPDAAIGTAVKQALSKWTFIPLPQAIRQATLTFYFQINAGRGRVLNPQDMPGGPAFRPTPSREAAPAAGSPPPPPPPPRTVVASDMPLNEIGLGEFRDLLKKSRLTVLDVRTRADFARAHHDGAINIPYTELPVRGGIELDKSRPVVVDCSRVENYVCRFAAHRLEGVKLPGVYALLP